VALDDGSDRMKEDVQRFEHGEPATAQALDALNKRLDGVEEIGSDRVEGQTG